MRSYCIKTNNENIINYLLNKIEKINFENIYYCDKLSNSIVKLNINNGEKRKINFKGEPKGVFLSQQ